MSSFVIFWLIPPPPPRVMTSFMNSPLIAQPDDLCYCSLGIGVDHLYFTTQIIEKYSTAMCYGDGDGDNNEW